MTMPQTRHYEMKDSGVEWIGEMPSHWQIQKAKYYITVTNGSDPVTEGEIPVYGSGSKSFRTCGEYKEGPTVLVGRKGSIDKPRYVTGRYWNVDTAFDVKTKGFDLRLYYYLATCFDYQFYMSQTTLPSMTQTNYRNMFLPVPPLSEQTAIAAYLDEKCATIDAIIAEAKASIEGYKSWKASVIFETVTKGLNPYAEMKDSGVEWIGEIPRAWSAKRIKTLALSSRSLFTDGDWINSPDISEAGIRYFTTGNIGQGYFKEQGNGYITTETFNRLNCTMVHAGDLIISRLNEPIGRACIIPGHYKDCIVAVDNVILRPDDGYNKKYLMYCMSSDRYAEYTALLARGTTMHRISRTQLGNIFLPIPPSSEQAFIVSYLDEKCAAIDDVIAEKEELIGELENYKKSLIFEVVTGKRRVC